MGLTCAAQGIRLRTVITARPPLPPAHRSAALRKEERNESERRRRGYKKRLMPEACRFKVVISFLLMKKLITFFQFTLLGIVTYIYIFFVY